MYLTPEARRLLEDVRHAHQGLIAHFHTGGVPGRHDRETARPCSLDGLRQGRAFPERLGQPWPGPKA